MSRLRTSLVDKATPYQMADFGSGRKMASSDQPQPLVLPDFTKPQDQAPTATMERNGFIPLLVGSRQEDPRTVAEREAEKLLASATGQAESIREQAHSAGYEAGYQQGLQEGREAAQATITAALDNLARVTQALEEVRANILANMEEELVALVAAATDLVLTTPGAVDREVIGQVVSQAVRRVAAAGRLTVHLNPADLEMVADLQPSLMQTFSELEHLELVPDPELERGGCLVDSNIAQIDATLATRRDQLLAVLDQALHSGEPLDLGPAAEEPAEPAEDQPGEPAAATGDDDDAGDLAEDW